MITTTADCKWGKAKSCRSYTKSAFSVKDYVD